VSRWPRALVIAGLVAGVLAGVLVAFAVPRTRDHVAAQAAAALPPVTPLRVAPAVPQPRSAGFVGLRARPGTVRLEARTRDPRGGPPWVLRVFRAERVVPKAGRRPGVDPVIGRDLCVQLGRVYRGRFGWIDARGTFRPVRVSFRGAPARCGSPKPDLAGRPEASFESLITDPDRPAARVYETVLWGLGGAAARSANARLGPRRVPLRLSAHGGFIVPGPAALHENQVVVDVRYARGPSRHVQLGPRPGMPFAVRPIHDRSAGPAAIEARAPDPNGGLAWGVVAAPSRGGGWCVAGPARIVGDRIGQVDAGLGTMRESLPYALSCSGNAPPLTRGRPLALGMMFGGGDSRTGPRRTARRTLPGGTVFHGTARADVASITIATPRDVRTLVPSRRAHAFIAVYDGTFPTGETVITTTFTDGTTHIDRLPPDPG
jgi:hypothetical protein